MPKRQQTVLTPEWLQSPVAIARAPVAITRAQMIYTSRDTLRVVLFEYRDAVRPVGDWIGLLGLVVSLWALCGVLTHMGWRGVAATMACLASLYLLVSVGQWAKLGYPNVSSVVDKLIADSDQGYASESVKGQLEIHHVVPPEGTTPRGGQPKKEKTP